MDVTVRRESGHPHLLTQVNSFEDLKDRGSQILNIEVVMVWKMTIGDNELDHETYRHLSRDTEVVFWTNLDRIMESLEAELRPTGSLRGNDEAHCIYNLFEMQVRGNLSDDKLGDEGDEDWFEGMTNKCDSKSKHMESKASSRIRKYYDKVAKDLKSIKDYIDKVKEVVEGVDKVLDEFKTQLKNNGWHKTLFGRNDGDAENKCDNEGKFKCQGVYNQTICPFHHIINPYRTREGRLQFQLWELDHCIEKSFVIGKLKDAIENARGRQIKTDYFYKLFFTTNLKLVYTACHDRNSRDDFNESTFKDSQVYQ